MNLPVKIVGIDKETDIAIIKYLVQVIHPSRLGTSADLKTGQLLIAIGNPLGLSAFGIRRRIERSGEDNEDSRRASCR